MAGKRWSKKEEAYLETLLGDHPFAMVVAYFNQWATKQGFTKRTPLAISCRIHRLSKACAPVGTEINAKALIDCLMIDGEVARTAWRRRIHSWCVSGKIVFSVYKSRETLALNLQKPGRNRYFTRKNLKAFAAEHPHLLQGAGRQGLFAVLEDWELVEKVVDFGKNQCARPGLPKPVRCIETGKTYSSCAEAARHLHISKSAIRRAVSKGHRTLGLRFTYVKTR